MVADILHVSNEMACVGHAPIEKQHLGAGRDRQPLIAIHEAMKFACGVEEVRELLLQCGVNNRRSEYSSTRPQELAGLGVQFHHPHYVQSLAGGFEVLA